MDTLYCTTVISKDTIVYESKRVGNTGSLKLVRKVNIGRPPESGLVQAYDERGNKVSTNKDKVNIDSLKFDSLSRRTYAWTGFNDQGFDARTMWTYLPSRFTLEDVVSTIWPGTQGETVTDYEYDRFGNITGIIEYDIRNLSPNNVRKAELRYNRKGQVLYFCDPSKENYFLTKIDYYNNGDIKSESYGDSIKISYGRRDVLGNQTSVTFKDGSGSYFQYDKRGRPVSIISIDSQGIPDTTRCDYNFEGKITRMSNESYNFSEFEYDNHGWLVSVNSSQFGKTNYVYDKFGQIIDKIIISPQGDTLLQTVYH
jgi:hypothetical protein